MAKLLLSSTLLLIWKYLEYPLYFALWKAYVILQVEFAINMSERKSWWVFAAILGGAVFKLIKNWRELDKQKIEIERTNIETERLKEELRQLRLDNDIKEKSLNA